MATLFSKAHRRKFLVWALPPLILVFAKLLYKSCKKNFHLQGNFSQTPSIYAMWHGELLLFPFAYMHYTQRTTVDAVISRHFDGEIVARFIALLGGGTLRGSSSKGGLEVLRSALRSLKKGRDLGITPDGPRGPKYTVAHGIVTLSALTKAPIITINWTSSSCWTMKSWDAFCIPKPFSTLEIYYGDPFYVHDLSTEEACALVREKLLQHAQ